MNNQQLWQAILGELELTISKANFTTWFKGTFVVDINDQEICVGVPNAFTKSWLEKKYSSDILTSFKKITPGAVIKIVKFKVDSPKNQILIEDVEKITAPIIKEERKPELGHDQGFLQPRQPTNLNTSIQFGLNQRYTFTSFVVGKGNELARAAALAVANNPGESYNPLFIYGPAGLGKTHLLHAIGNEILKKSSNKKILYISCEKFVNDYIDAVRNGRGQQFKDVYRTVDCLLVDDIQFLAGKEGTQEEFFHTFNTLHQANKQLVISSDRQPQSIPTLENRLLTRFQWGMIADISQPDVETRRAILMTKSQEKNYNLSPEIIDFIANNIASNVRELEGALNRIIAHHQLNNVVLTIDTVKQILSAITISPAKKPITVKDVINIVASYYDVPVIEILGKCRNKNLVGPRQIVMYLLRHEMECSFPTIGDELGGRDHTTAMHACTKITKDYQSNEKLRGQIDQIKERLYTY